jgi:hypothetical protein
MIARLMSEDMLETLDYGQIPNAENGISRTSPSPT